MSPSHHGVRSQSLTPPHFTTNGAFIDLSAPKPRGPVVQRSQSHFNLGSQYANSQPIYQTSGHRNSSPHPQQRYFTSPPPLHLHAPAPLLPSFLQDIVQSPSLSPASTSSADLSFEEYEDSIPSPNGSNNGRGRTSSRDDSANLPLGNIWRLDGEETKSLSAFALPNRQDLIGGSRKNSTEKLRL